MERRAEKLSEMLQAMGTGLLNLKELPARQSDLPTQDVRDTKTGDEEESEEGLEESDGRLLARQTGAVRIKASDVMAAAEV